MKPGALMSPWVTRAGGRGRGERGRGGGDRGGTYSTGELGGRGRGNHREGVLLGVRSGE